MPPHRFPLIAVLLPSLLLGADAAWAQNSGGDPGRKRSDGSRVRTGNGAASTSGPPGAEIGSERNAPSTERRADPRDRTRGPLDPDPWQAWWERHLPSYTVRVVTQTKAAPAFLLDPAHRDKSRDRLRSDVLDVLREGLASADASLRGTAAVAMSMVVLPGDREFAEELRAMMRESRSAVLDQALLAAALAPASPARYDLLRLVAGHSTVAAPTATASEIERLRGLVAVFLALGEVDGLDAFLRDELVNRRNSQRHRALWIASLGIAGCKSALESLAGIATDEREPTLVRCAAVDALGRIGEPDSAATVAALLTRGESAADLRASAALALGGLSPDRGADVLEALERAVQRDGNTSVRSFALLSLGRIGGTSAEMTLTHALLRGTSTERPFAALGLGLRARAGSQDVVPVLIQQLSRSRNADERCVLIAALGLSRDERAFGPIAAAAGSEHESPEIRRCACEALRVNGHSGAPDVLEQVLVGEKNPDVRNAAATALGLLDPIGTLRLHRCLVGGDRSSSQQRVPVLRALGWTGDPQAIPLLIDEWQRPSATSAERQAAAWALGRMYRSERHDATDPVGFENNFFRESTEIDTILALTR